MIAEASAPDDGLLGTASPAQVLGLAHLASRSCRFLPLAAGMVHHARMRLLLCLVALTLAACGGSVETTNQAQGDASFPPEGGADTAHDAAVPEADARDEDGPLSAEASDDAFACKEGTGDCNGNLSDGCEVAFSNNPAHCGACDHPCAPAPHASASCSAGQCVSGACEPGFADCDEAAQGCESDLLHDPDNCGACALSCPTGPCGNQCHDGACTIASCTPGHANCDCDAANGCEADLQNDPGNCGGCGFDCFQQTGCLMCSQGMCIGECPAGLTICVKCQCADLSTDPSNCGMCGLVCAAGQVCVMGSCQ